MAATVYRKEQGPQRFDRKLDSEDDGERSERGLSEGTPETHLRGLGGSLRASRYLDKNNGIIDGTLHISTLFFSFRIYIVCITPFCGRDSNTLAK